MNANLRFLPWGTTGKDEGSDAIREFNKIVSSDTRVETLMLPFRDGITCIRKVTPTPTLPNHDVVFTGVENKSVLDR